jgi:hypothetical protein
MRSTVLLFVSMLCLGGCAGPRYQVDVGGSSAILLNTYTGEMWAPTTMVDGQVIWERVGPHSPSTRPTQR